MASPQRKHISARQPQCRHRSHTDTSILVFAHDRGGQSGGALFPVLVGVAADFKGAKVVHPVVLALLVAQMLLWLSVWWASRAGSRGEPEGHLALSPIATDPTPPKQVASLQLHGDDAKV